MTIIKQGDEPGELYILIQGRVDLMVTPINIVADQKSRYYYTRCDLWGDVNARR